MNKQQKRRLIPSFLNGGASWTKLELLLLEKLYEAIVSRELYYICQNIIKSKTNTKCNRKSFLFSHIIKCTTCGCTHVGEIKKGKYVYYHCTGNKGGDCKRKYLKELHVEEVFLNTLDSIKVSDENMPVIINQIKSRVEYENAYNDVSKIEVDKQIKALKNRLNKMFNLYLDGKVEDSFYNEKKIEFEEEIERLSIRQKLINEQSINIINYSQKLLELLRDARSLYIKGTLETKQELIKLVCSNFYYDGENLTIAIKKAFQPIVKIACFKNGGR